MIRKLIKPNLREIKQKSNRENKRKPPPPYKTHAENYYYIKQMNNRTQLVMELIGGEVLKGLLDWYDEKCLKVKKLDGGTLIVFKSQIKYIYKNPDFAEPKHEEPVQENKIIAVTLGDPQGIGPETIEKSLAAYSPGCSLVLVGSRRFFPTAPIRVIRTVREVDAGETALLEVEEGPAGADPSFSWVQAAVGLALRGEVQALVTAPVSKDKWLASGLPYRGHTDFLATVAKDAAPAMFFWSPGLKVALFTHHIALRDVFARIDGVKISAFVRLVDTELRRLFGQEFTYLFSGLNPHAGENGHLGNEEIDVLIPVMNELRKQVPVTGIFPPDVVFAKARAMKGAVVIAWTHDQGLIPFKLLQAGNGVQLTLGLPFVRTSPVHGTAYDIAGQGIADPSSMLAAIRLAESLLR